MKFLGCLLITLAVVAVMPGCGEEFDNEEGYLEEIQQELVIPPEEPCHVDVDRHFFYRTAEAYGDEETVEAGVSRYRKVMMVSNRCSWNIPAHRCADEAWRAAWAETHGGRWQDAPPMPNAVYDNNTCQQSAGGGGGSPGPGNPSPMMQH